MLCGVSSPQSACGPLPGRLWGQFDDINQGRCESMRKEMEETLGKHIQTGDETRAHDLTATSHLVQDAEARMMKNADEIRALQETSLSTMRDDYHHCTGRQH